MTQKERRELKITVWGESQGLWATARTFWLKEGNPANNQEDREKLLSEIIEGGIKSKKEIFKTKFIERLENKFGKNIESFTDEDKGKLVIMTIEERNKAFEITVWGEPQSLDKIATACWVEGEPAKIQKDREKLLSEIIKEGIKSKEEITDALNEEIRKETIRYFNEHYATKKIENWKEVYAFTDEDKEKLVMMSQEEKREFKITVWGESQSLDKIATAYWVEGLPVNYQKDREKLLSEIIWAKIKSKKELIKKYFTKDFPTAKETKEKLSAMTERGRSDYKISIQGRKLGLRSMAKDFWIEGNPVKDLEVLEKLIDTIWTYEPPEEKSLSLAKDSLQAHHCELNKEALIEEVNSTNTDEVAKVLQ